MEGKVDLDGISTHNSEKTDEIPLTILPDLLTILPDRSFINIQYLITGQGNDLTESFFFSWGKCFVAFYQYLSSDFKIH